MEARVMDWVKEAGCDEILYIDNTSAELSIYCINNFSLIFKYTAFEHEEIPRNMFYDFLVGAI